MTSATAFLRLTGRAEITAARRSVVGGGRRIVGDIDVPGLPGPVGRNGRPCGSAEGPADDSALASAELRPEEGPRAAAQGTADCGVDTRVASARRPGTKGGCQDGQECDRRILVHLGNSLLRLIAMVKPIWGRSVAVKPCHLR